MAKADVGAIQLREKDLPASEILSIARELQANFKKYKTKLLINDRLDIAMLAKCDGIHSPSAGIGNYDIRKFSNIMLAGKSVHSVKEAVKAEKDGYNYLLFGPVFRTPAKVKYGKPQGLKKLNEICSAAAIPVFAVGGITPGRVKKCINAGAYGIACISEFMTAANPRKTVNEFISEITGN